MQTPYRNISFILKDSILLTMPANDNDHLVSFIKYLRTSIPEWESVMIADWDRKLQYHVPDIWNYLIKHGMVNEND